MNVSINISTYFQQLSINYKLIIKINPQSLEITPIFGATGKCEKLEIS